MRRSDVELLAKMKMVREAEAREAAERGQMFSIPWEGGRCVFGGGPPGSYAPPERVEEDGE